MRRTVLILALLLLSVGLLPAFAQGGVVEPALPDEPSTETAPVPEPEAQPERVLFDSRGDRVTMGDRMIIPEDTVHRGSITSIAGQLEILGRVTGDVVVVGGDFKLDGTVDGDVVAVLSDVNLSPSTRVEGSLVAVAGSMDDSGASIGRDRVNIPLGLTLPGLGHPLEILFSIFLWWILLGLILMFFAVLVLAALVPERVELLAEELPVRWPGALILGLAFAVLGMPLIYVLLALSLIGIPLIPFAFFTYVVLKWMGIAGIFMFVGQKLGSLAGRRITLLPAVLLGFLVFGLIKMIPVVGFLVWLILGWIGIGLVLLTRFGKRRKQVQFQPPVQTVTPAQQEPRPEAGPETTPES